MASRAAAASRWSAPPASRCKRFRLLCHGGAWDIPSALVAPHSAGVGAAYEAAARALRGGADPLDAVVHALGVMEDDPTFDAGYGSFLNAEGRVVSAAAARPVPAGLPPLTARCR
jgi:isoaspartyl peptidase/L-asparaginase-like protein (Ntn-hydrolase superfamily)